MSVRLVITFTAPPGRGDELIRDIARRNETVLAEPGCEQFEIFRSIVNPDKLVIHERWKDQAALDVHAEAGKSKPPGTPGLRIGDEREDYIYNRTR